MLKIGDFSRLARVSTKTLRHYDTLGLLKPAHIDRFSGYRYYSLEQLPRLNRILALKDLGFSLDQVKQMLRTDLPAAELRGMVRLKYAELQQQVAAEQARLERVAARLRQIEQEGRLPGYEVVVKPVTAQRVAGIRAVLPTYRHLGGLFIELAAYLQAKGLAPEAAQPWMGLYYDAEYQDQRVDVEAAVPLARSLPGTPRITIHDLPGAEAMACVVHQGAYDDLPGAYGTVMAWTQANGYRITGPNREIYLQGPQEGLPPARYITEVQFPIARPDLTGLANVSHTEGEKEGRLEPQLVDKPEFKIVGMLYRGKNEHNEISAMWQEFNPRMGEIRFKEQGICAGVCYMPEGAPEGVFEYIAALEVPDFDNIPAGMVGRTVPAQRYAVFPVPGLKAIRATYDYALGTWLPQAGYKYGQGPDFELYPETFDTSDPENSVFYIYIPVKPA